MNTLTKVRSTYASLIAMLATWLVVAPSFAMQRVDSRSVARGRAVTFIEYALLAAVIVAVAWVFRGRIVAFVGAMWTNITNAFNGVSAH